MHAAFHGLSTRFARASLLIGFEYLSVPKQKVYGEVMVWLGVILLVVSAVAASCAVVMQCRANPHVPLPWLFRRPPQITWPARIMFGLAGGVGALGAAQLFDTLGYWAFTLIFVAWMASFAIQYKHNRDATRRYARENIR